ncbi:hypothetical protein EDC01DRAFT_778532 [Geopyxis carbonaria]|nr:hypothetical protein EDC01DRAFT_778532 [Geopyxis carbonaria]
MFRNFRSVLNHSRLPLKVDSKNAKVYRVRFLPQAGRLSITRTLFTLSAYTFIGYYWYRTVLSISRDEPIFIPLSLPKLEPSPRYKPDDPEMEEIMKFTRDRHQIYKVRQAIKDRAIVALQKAMSARGFGGNIKADVAMLYFHMPNAPPPVYVQKGIQISFTPTEEKTEETVGILEISYLERVWDRDHQLKKSQILFPTWMYNAMSAAVKDIYYAIRSPRNPEEEPMETLDDVVQYGAGLAEWTFSNFKDDLRKTRPIPPPPRGHILVDGVVQIETDTVIVAVDLTGSFAPNNLEDVRMQHMKVRFMGHKRRRRPMPLSKAPSPPAEVVERLRAENKAYNKITNDQMDKLADALKKPPPSTKRETIEHKPIIDTQTPEKSKSDGIPQESDVLRPDEESSRSKEDGDAGDDKRPSRTSPPPSSRPLDK